MSDEATLPPRTAEALRALIVERSPSLSKRLQHVAQFVLDHADEVALETLTVVAARSGAQPSTIVRFAKALGFSGSTPMQRLLREELLANNPGLGYGERIRRFNLESSGAKGEGSLLAAFVAGDLLALRNLQDKTDQAALERAIDLIHAASRVYLLGMRRAFPVAAYLTYALLRGGKAAELLDGAGGLVNDRARLLGSGDLLLATSFHPYALETAHACSLAAAAGAPIVAITDSLLSPLAEHAAETLLVKEAEVRGFRSLSATMCLAQTLVVGLAARGDGPAEPVAPKTRRRTSGKSSPKIA